MSKYGIIHFTHFFISSRLFWISWFLYGLILKSFRICIDLLKKTRNFRNVIICINEMAKQSKLSSFETWLAWTWNWISFAKTWELLQGFCRKFMNSDVTGTNSLLKNNVIKLKTAICFYHVLCTICITKWPIFNCISPSKNILRKVHHLIANG